MRILVSPTMKMSEESRSLPYKQLPMFLKDTQKLVDYLQTLTYEELKDLWKCSDSLAQLNSKRIRQMDLRKNLTPAILAFQGLQYQYIAADVFTYEELAYLEEHLRILSGFYGILKPFDGVTPYRLEMKATFLNFDFPSLYDFWDDKLSEQLNVETNQLVNLASKEYSEAVLKHLDKDVQVVTCVFGEWIDGKVKQKATLAKMARGEMVRFMAENQVKDFEEIKEFNRLSYVYNEDLSDSDRFVFLQKKE